MGVGVGVTGDKEQRNSFLDKDGAGNLNLSNSRRHLGKVLAKIIKINMQLNYSDYQTGR